MNPLAGYGLLAHGLIFGAFAALLPLGFLRPRVALAATALALVVGIAPAMHGTFGTPSLTLLQLALLQHANRSPSPLDGRAAGGILLCALPFYAAALGWGPFDPYALGYQPLPLLAALLPVGLALWWRQQHLWLGILGIDLLGYASGLFVNLWDVLLDPLLVSLSLAVVVRRRLLPALAGWRAKQPPPRQ